MANVKWSAFPAGSVIGATDNVVGLQSGADVLWTWAQAKTWTSASPTLVTPVLGTPSSGTLTSCTGLPISTGVSGLGTGVATFLATPSSANLLSALTTSTGTGTAVFSTSPTLTTPTLGVATVTSVNKMAITAPATSATLTIADGKTLTASNTLTLTATDGSTLAIGTGGTLGTAAYVATGTSGATVPLLNGANTWSSTQTMTAATALTLGAASGNTGLMTFKGTTSGTVSLTTAAAAGTWTMTLPTSGGTNAYVLQTDGSGITSWVPQSGGSGLTLNSTTISGSTAGRILYGDGTLLQQALLTYSAGILQLGADDAASPVAQTLQVQSVVAGTSNIAGADWTKNLSAGTGTGVGGKMIWNGAVTGSSGTSQNARVRTMDLTPGASSSAGGILNLYNMYTDASNYESGSMQWNTNVLSIGTFKAGTGTSRSLGLYVGGVRIAISDGSFFQSDKDLYGPNCFFSGTVQVASLKIVQTPTAISQATTMTFSSGADSSGNIGHRVSVNLNGTTYWIPCSTTAF